MNGQLTLVKLLISFLYRNCAEFTIKNLLLIRQS